MNEYLNRYKKIKVTSESLIRFEGKAYSVDPEYINCLVDVQKENNQLKIYYKDNLIETFDFEKYNQKINYKENHYCKALAQALGNNIKSEEIENKALENLKATKKVLLVVDELTDNIILATRNIKEVVLLEASEINTYDVIAADNMIITEKAVKQIEEVLV